MEMPFSAKPELCTEETRIHPALYNFGALFEAPVLALMSSIIPKRTYLNICRNSTLNIIRAEGVKSTIGFM